MRAARGLPVPEFSEFPLTLLGAGHDPPVALQLIYQMLSTLLSWIVLRTRSDPTNEIEVWSFATSLPCSDAARPGR